MKGVFEELSPQESSIQREKKTHTQRIINSLNLYNFLFPFLEALQNETLNSYCIRQMGEAIIKYLSICISPKKKKRRRKKKRHYYYLFLVNALLLSYGKIKIYFLRKKN